MENVGIKSVTFPSEDNINFLFTHCKAIFNFQVPVLSTYDTDCLKSITNDPTFSIGYVPSFINLSKHTKCE